MGVAVTFTSSQVVVECCKSTGVAVAFTSSQIVLESRKSAGVAVAFIRLVGRMSALLDAGEIVVPTSSGAAVRIWESTG